MDVKVKKKRYRLAKKGSILKNISKQLSVFLNENSANLFFISTDRLQYLKVKDSLNVSLHSCFNHLKKAFSGVGCFIIWLI